MSKVEQVLSCYREGFMCSQALLSVYCEGFGLESELALKLAEGFGGGMGSMGETCGAVTGAFMVIGFKHGRTRVDDVQANKKTFSLINEFAREFKARNGSIDCRELIDCDISTSKGMSRAREENLFTTICPKYVQDAAEIVEELLGL